MLETSVIHWQVRHCSTQDAEHCLLCRDHIELERKIQELQDRCRDLRARMNAYHDPFVLKFPPEIGSYIFSSSLEPQDYEPSVDALKKLPTQFLLASVCRGWRQLAQSTPSLWSTLSFTLTKPTKREDLRARVQHISNWLQLSGSLPLTLAVFNYVPNRSRIKPLSPEICGPVIDALNQHSGRWHKVSICLPASYIGHFCGTSPPRNLCDLEIINHPFLEIEVSPTVTFRMSSRRPSPNRLTLDNFHFLAVDLSWNNLTFLKVEHTPFDGCIEAIRQAPLLEFCSLRQHHRSSSRDIQYIHSIPKTIIRLLHLRTLKLLYFRPEVLTRFIDLLELPSLEEYHCSSSEGDAALDRVISLFKRSGNCLKQLVFCLQPQAGEDLKRLLYAVPCLQNLKLDFSPSGRTSFADYLLQQLTFSVPISEGSISGFLPQLQSLTLSVWQVSMWRCIPRIFIQPHRKNLSLEVNNCEIEIDDDTLAKILQLINQGVNIRLLKNWQVYHKQFK